MNKKILVVLILGVFLFSLVSVSAVSTTYNEETKTIEIKDTFLFIPIGDRAEIQLKTDMNKDGVAELHAKVPISPDKKILVAEFEVRSFKDYKDALKSMKFYNKKKENFRDYEIQKDFEYRYKIIDQIEVPTFETQTNYLVNGTAYTSQVQIGTHFVERERWEILTKKDYVDGDIITVGIFTTTEKGEYVEWIPTDFFGVEIPEFASWSASLDTNLIAYYKFDGDLNDAKGNYNLTNSGTSNVTGKVIYGRDNENSDPDAILSSVLPTISATSDKTMGFWFKPESYGGAGTYNFLWDSGGGDRFSMSISDNDAGGQLGTCIGGDCDDYGTGADIPVGSFYFIVLVIQDSGTNASLYLNNSLLGTVTTSPGAIDQTKYIGSRYSGANTLHSADGIFDEWFLYDRALTVSEINELWGEGDGCSYQDCLLPTPVITLNSPTNNTTSSNKTINFNGTISINTPLNVSLIIDDVYNETNTSGILGDYLFTKILNDGVHTWTYESCNVDGCSNATVRTLTIDTTPFIDWITPPTLPNYANITQEYFPMKVNVSTNYYKNNSFDLYNVNGTSFHQTYTDQTFDINFTDLPDAHYHYNATICTTTNKCNSTETRHINHDVTPPEINISSPTGEYNYLYVEEILDFNFTVTDELANVSECWWNYNGTNNSIACTNGTLVSLSIAQELDNYNITVYSNDTFGNVGQETKTWIFKILETSRSFNNETIEGNFEDFILYLEKGAGIDVTNVVLHYNGQSHTSSLFSSGDDVTAMSELFISNVVADINKTLYFTVTLSDSTILNTTNSTQLVKNIALDDCSSQPHLFLTLNLLDEETQSPLSGDIETYLSVINAVNFQEILNFTGNYSSITSKTFCSNLLLNATTFLFNAEIRYDSENHSAEFYNIQRSELANYPKVFELYDLKTEDTTKFKLIYQGEDLVGVEGAIIQLQRKYISEGVYKIVEAPLTSSESTAIVHIDTDTTLYKATIVKDGVLLNTFENLAFICQSELTGECTLDLLEFIVPPTSISIETINDFTYALESSIDNKTITISYSVPSGTTSTINVVAVQTDIIGESNICNTTVSSAGGSIECQYNDSIQDSFIDYFVYKDDELIAQKSYVVQDDLRDDFQGDNYFILIIFVISLIFMASLSPEWIVINAIISVIIGGATWLIRGMDFVLGLGAIAWLLLGATIIIIKMSKQEDQ